MVRYPLVVLVEQGRLSQEEAAREMGLSTRQVRRVLKRYRESAQRLESLAYQRRHPAWNALPDSTNEEIRRLHREYPHWSAPAIAEALAATEGVAVHRATVHRLLRREAGNPLPRHRRPARRFEMRAFGELWQMDTTVGAWLQGYRPTCAGRQVCVVPILDDYSRQPVAAGVFPSDSSYHSLLTLRQAAECKALHLLLVGDGAEWIETLAGHARWRATHQLDWWHLTYPFHRTLPDQPPLEAEPKRDLHKGDGERLLRLVRLAPASGRGDPEGVAKLETYVQAN